MPGQSTAVVRTEAVPSSQLVGSAGRVRVSRMQYRRIVDALRTDKSERKIAEGESVEERLVRQIRALEFERAERQMDAIGVSVSGFLQNVRHLHAEIDRSIFEDLQEVA